MREKMPSLTFHVEKGHFPKNWISENPTALTIFLKVTSTTQSCKKLGSVVALLQGNFEKVMTLRQILRKNAQF